MVSIPINVQQTVKKYATCPDAIWQTIVYLESNFNASAVGGSAFQGGYSYGLFQLLVGQNGIIGQGNAALAVIKSRFNLDGQTAITYLLQHIDIQAEIGMQPINKAWDQLRNSFSPQSNSWWLNFCSISGHPGGSVDNPTTIAYVDRLMRSVVNPNLFGIQQLQQGAGPSSVQTQDNTWLQTLINMPAHQPCSIVWRRSCPGAKAANEGGMDLPSPSGTKVYALGSGVVVGAGYFWHADGSAGYGVVTIRTNMPDGSFADIYYQHIALSPAIILCNQKGGQLYGGVVGPAPSNQLISAGQFLGTVTAQGEVEVGINATLGGVWGDSPHPGPWLDDPEDSIRSLMNNGGGINTNGIFFSVGNPALDAYLTKVFEQSQTGLQTVLSNPGLAGPIQAFDNAQRFRPFAIPKDNSFVGSIPGIGAIEQTASYPVRITIGVITFLLNNSLAFIIRGIFTTLAVVILIALILNIVSNVASEQLDTAGNMLPLVAAL